MQAAKHAQQQAAHHAQVSQAVSAESEAVQPGSVSHQSADAAPAPANVGADPVTLAATDAAPSSGRKRRRTAVDYIALNKQMEAEGARDGQTASLSFATTVASTAVGVHAGDVVPNERPDSLMDDTALVAEQALTSPQQPHEGDKMV